MSDIRIISESLSGIRGIYGQGVDIEYARLYARVFILSFKNKNNKSIVLGADTRKSSQALLDVFIEEFRSAGFIVYNIGFSTVPVVEFGVRYYKAVGGVMVTASHNEPEFNGWKLLDHTGAVLQPDVMNDIITQVHTGDNIKTKNLDTGSVVDVHMEVIEAYIDEIFKILTPDVVEKIKAKNYSLVVDPNGSAVWEVLEKFCQKLNIDVTAINTDQGVFNRPIEPTFETLTGLIDIVTDKKAIFGCGFDCDADRVEVVVSADSEYAEANGSMVSGQYVLALGVNSVLADSEFDDYVVVNFATSYLVHDVAGRFKAEVSEVDVGEVNVVNAMCKKNAIIGGEGSSSGVIVRGTTCRDGIMVIGLILKLLAEQNKDLDQILLDYPVYYEERIKISCKSNQVEQVRRKLLGYFKEKNIKTLTSSSDLTSGVKALYPDGLWLFFRASKTEPGIFRIIVNGRDKDLVREYLLKAQDIFNNFS